MTLNAIVKFVCVILCVYPKEANGCNGKGSGCLNKDQFTTLKEIIWSCSAGGSIRYARQYKMCVVNVLGQYDTEGYRISDWYQNNCATIMNGVTSIYQGNEVEQYVQFCEAKMLQSGVNILTSTKEILLKEVLGCRASILRPPIKGDNKTQMHNFVTCVKTGVKYNIQAFDLFKQCPQGIKPGNTSLEAIAECLKVVRYEKGFWQSLNETPAKAIFIVEIMAVIINVFVLVFVLYRKVFRKFKQTAKPLKVLEDSDDDPEKL